MLRVLLQPVQRTIAALLSGGSQGQILVKKSEVDGDIGWEDAPEGVVDNTLNPNSENAVSNKAVTESLTWQKIKKR